MLRTITRLVQQRKFNYIYRYRDNPLKIQEKILLSIVNKNKSTEFGKNHDFSIINTIADYQAKVPINSYESFKPSINNIYQGKQNILTKESPFFFAMTSGSTGEHKYIPVTKSYRREVDRGALAYYYLLEKNFPGIADKKIQFIVHTGDKGLSPGAIPQGFISGHNYKVLPSIIRKRFVIPYEVFTIEDVEAQFYCMARFLLEEQNLGAIGAITPLALIEIGKTIENYGEKLIEDLFYGKISCKYYSPSTNLKSKVSKRKDIAESLSKFINRGNKLIPADAFPNLQVLACWKGGNMFYYIPEIKRYFGDKPIFELPFSASEGFFAIPYKPNNTGGITAITSHFLEFVPEAEMERDNPQAITVDRLELNQYYYVIITNSSGLYRYDIEDLIYVKDFWYKIPVIEFKSKKSRIVSILNEQIKENDVTQAMYSACKKCKRYFDTFLFVPILENKRYRVLIDSTKTDKKDISALKKFAEVIDYELRQLARIYDDDRAMKYILGLEVALVKPNQLKQYLASRLRSNKVNSQTKPLHLSNDFNLYRQFDIICFAASDD